MNDRYEVAVTPGDCIDNEQLCEEFKCSSQGGIRRSKRTNTLVLVSNHVMSIYDDKWIGNVLHYTGMGSEGDQTLDFMQNKTLSNSASNGVDVHLFEVFKKGEYTYAGRVILKESAYEENQVDANMKKRSVWMFPLELENGLPPIYKKEQLDKNVQQKKKIINKISTDDLLQQVKMVSNKPGTRRVESSQYDRNPLIAELAQRYAKGICQLCDEPAPFNRKDGSPYLEAHHINWLSKGGDDAIENTVALCPNCHRKMHSLDNKADITKLQNISLRY